MSENGVLPAIEAATRRRQARLAERQAARQVVSRANEAAEADPLQAAPTPADVLGAYLWMLGRAPEDAGVVTRLLARLESRAALRTELLRSSEFRQRVGAEALPGLPVDAPAMIIETVAGPAEREALLLALRREWARLGEMAPYWSCRPEAAFRPDRMAAHKRAFYASGMADRRLVEGVLARHRIAPEQLGRAVDFGCGLGRATLHLAAICPEVAGIDISAPHLALARAEARARGLDHIAWLRARPDRPMPAEGYGLWYSRSVLQHVPPPLARHLLELAFAGLAPGGLAVFQALTYGAGYGYAAGTAPPAPGSAPEELHVLPQSVIFDTAAAAGLRVLEVQEDPAPGLDRGRWLSHLFVLQRPA
jgi:SAM-dependent methyltransferase